MHPGLAQVSSLPRRGREDSDGPRMSRLANVALLPPLHTTGGTHRVRRARKARGRWCRDRKEADLQAAAESIKSPDTGRVPLSQVLECRSLSPWFDVEALTTALAEC